MKIEKAIEIQTEFINDPAISHLKDLKDSMKLGIEALKRHKGIKTIVPDIPYPPLPGETDE